MLNTQQIFNKETRKNLKRFVILSTLSLSLTMNAMQFLNQNESTEQNINTEQETETLTPFHNVKESDPKTTENVVGIGINDMTLYELNSLQEYEDVNTVAVYKVDTNFLQDSLGTLYQIDLDLSYTLNYDDIYIITVSDNGSIEILDTITNIDLITETERTLLNNDM